MAEQPDRTHRPAYPPVGEVFELTLDGDAPENEPLEMVNEFGFNPSGWQYIGAAVSGRETRRFQFVQVGYCSTVERVKDKIGPYGKVPAGQWINAFKAAYPEPDGQGPVGFADASWVSADGRANFPYVASVGFLHFNYGGHVRGEDWRWFVQVS